MFSVNQSSLACHIAIAVFLILHPFEVPAQTWTLKRDSGEMLKLHYEKEDMEDGRTIESLVARDERSSSLPVDNAFPFVPFDEFSVEKDADGNIDKVICHVLFNGTIDSKQLYATDDGKRFARTSILALLVALGEVDWTQPRGPLDISRAHIPQHQVALSMGMRNDQPDLTVQVPLRMEDDGELIAELRNSSPELHMVSIVEGTAHKNHWRLWVVGPLASPTGMTMTRLADEGGFGSELRPYRTGWVRITTSTSAKPEFAALNRIESATANLSMKPWKENTDFLANEHRSTDWHWDVLGGGDEEAHYGILQWRKETDGPVLEWERSSFRILKQPEDRKGRYSPGWFSWLPPLIEARRESERLVKELAFVYTKRGIYEEAVKTDRVENITAFVMTMLMGTGVFDMNYAEPDQSPTSDLSGSVPVMPSRTCTNNGAIFAFIDLD